MKQSGNTIIVATRNKGKVAEFSHAFEALGKQVRSMFDYPDLPDVVEDGDTFAANAFKKAKTVGDALGLPVLADDSGLCVERLDGAPGVYSARYAGEHGNDKENNLKLLNELEKLQLSEEAEPPLLSPAQFVCALVLYDPASGKSIETQGVVEGWITADPHGEGGFGYDPLFYLPEYEKTMAELTIEEKQAISHRGRALKQLVQKLAEQME